MGNSRSAGQPRTRAVVSAAVGGPLLIGVLTVCLTGLGAMSAAGVNAPGPAAPEYAVKAAFLLHFARFVEWPTAVWRDPAEPLRIGIAGRDPFGSAIDQLTQRRLVRSRPVVVHRVDDVSELGDCHILFIAAEERRLEEIFARLEGRPVLTVGESQEFLNHGGMIRFKVTDRKVRFEIAPAAADRAGLKLSSKLLSLARIVGGEGDRDG